MKTLDTLEQEITAIRTEYAALDARRATLTDADHARVEALYAHGCRLRQRAKLREEIITTAERELPERLLALPLYDPHGTAFDDLPWIDSLALTRARVYFESELDEGRCLVLSGPTGVGKSYAAAAVLGLAGGHFAFWPQSCGRLLRPDLRDAELARLKTHHLLVIDDLGMEYAKEGGFLEALTDEVIWHREGNYGPTIITTNLTPDDMRSRWSSRIVDRLRSSWATVFAVTGESLRRQP